MHLSLLNHLSLMNRFVARVGPLLADAMWLPTRSRTGRVAVNVTVNVCVRAPLAGCPGIMTRVNPWFSVCLGLPWRRMHGYPWLVCTPGQNPYVGLRPRACHLANRVYIAIACWSVRATGCLLVGNQAHHGRGWRGIRLSRRMCCRVGWRDPCTI